MHAIVVCHKKTYGRGKDKDARETMSWNMGTLDKRMKNIGGVSL